MNCHQGGIKRQDDDVLAHFQGIEETLKDSPRSTPALFPPGNDRGGGINLGVDFNLRKAIRDVKRLFKGNEVLNQAYKKDEEAYSQAIQKTGNSVEVADPVFATSTQFEAPIDLKSVAAELDYDPKLVEEYLKTHLDIKQRLGMGKENIVDREVFNANFLVLKELLERYRPSKDLR